MNETKSPIDTLLDRVDWIEADVIPNSDGLPYVTHQGILQLGEISITVYVLNTGQRIIPAEEMERILTGS